MNSYTELFEYAGQLVRNFIDDEIALSARDPEKLFGESSWQSNFFGFNMRQLSYEAIRKQVDVMLDNKETEQRPYNAALARVTSLFTTLVVGCGIDHVNKMIENAIAAIKRIEMPLEEDYIQKTFDKHPVLIVSILGNPYFLAKKIDYIRKNSIKSNLSGGSRK